MDPYILLNKEVENWEVKDKQLLLQDIAKSIGLEMKDISDGYHSFDELYEFRKLYNALYFNQLSQLNISGLSVYKSWRHEDGELCFGGGWFIVVTILPSGQVTNHYKAEDWDLFQIQEVEKPKDKWDGHTSSDVRDRLFQMLDKSMKDSRMWFRRTGRTGRIVEELAEKLSNNDVIIIPEVGNFVGDEEGYAALIRTDYYQRGYLRKFNKIHFGYDHTIVETHLPADIKKREQENLVKLLREKCKELDFYTTSVNLTMGIRGSYKAVLFHNEFRR